MRESSSQCFMVQAGSRFRLPALRLTDENLGTRLHLTAKETGKYILTVSPNKGIKKAKTIDLC